MLLQMYASLCLMIHICVSYLELFDIQAVLSSAVDCHTHEAIRSRNTVRRTASFSSTRKSSSLVEAVLTAELRNVVVLFMKINVCFSLTHTSRSNNNNNDSNSNNSNSTSSKSGITLKSTVAERLLGFLPRTAEEREADQRMLAELQCCYAIIVKALLERGGQVRQFIVDDKGTVCIGSFGLRGSSTDDNAGGKNEM